MDLHTFLRNNYDFIDIRFNDNRIEGYLENEQEPLVFRRIIELERQWGDGSFALQDEETDEIDALVFVNEQFYSIHCYITPETIDVDQYTLNEGTPKPYYGEEVQKEKNQLFDYLVSLPKYRLPYVTGQLIRKDI